MTEGLRADASQSEFNAHMAHQEDVDQARWKNASIASYVHPPLFPAAADTLVVWGLDDVLVSVSSAIEQAYETRAPAALRKLVKTDVIDADKVKRQARLSFRRVGHPVRFLAEEHGVNEALLLSTLMADVAQNEISLDPSKFGMTDQGLLNYFEVSSEHKMAHAAVSGNSFFFAQTCLHFSALTQYFGTRIHGADTLGFKAPLPAKSHCGARYIDAIFAQIPQARHRDVVVVDRYPAYLQAAKDKGAKAILVDKQGRYPALAQPFDGYVRSTEAVFETHFGIRDPGSHRDTHIYAGAGGLLL